MSITEQSDESKHYEYANKAEEMANGHNPWCMGCFPNKVEALKLAAEHYDKAGQEDRADECRRRVDAMFDRLTKDK